MQSGAAADEMLMMMTARVIQMDLEIEFPSRVPRDELVSIQCLLIRSCISERDS